MTIRTHQSARLDVLLAEARRTPHVQLTSGSAMHLYARLGIACKRSTAQDDLKAAAARGWLTPHGPDNRRHYTLSRGTR